MAFPCPAEPSALLAERRAQCIALGIPAATVDEVGAGLGHELWADEPGSWVREWSLAASAAEDTGDLLQAALCFGMAKYPCVGSPAHAQAYREQLRTYLAAAPGLPVAFERRNVAVDYRGSTTDVAVHLFRPDSRPDHRPVVVMLGGVDTWKMDIHRSVIRAVTALDATVVAVDGPGVGESRVPSRPDGDRVLAGVVAGARSWGDGRVGVAGWSFGATWAVKLALTGAVDAAMANGAPVDAAFDPAIVARWPNGMTGITGNSLHRNAPFPDAAAAAEALAGFRLSHQGLLGDWGADPTPLLVVNGADDPYVPPVDVTVFDDRPHTVTRLEPHATHCAAEKAREINPWALGWLRSTPPPERPGTALTAYDPLAWHDFYLAVAGAAAALTGLIFVAVSINLDRILPSPLLPARAAESLTVLLMLLVISLCMLAPDQPALVLGAELIAIGLFLLARVTRSPAYRHRPPDTPLHWIAIPATVAV